MIKKTSEFALAAIYLAGNMTLRMFAAAVAFVVLSQILSIVLVEGIGTKGELISQHRQHYRAAVLEHVPRGVRSGVRSRAVALQIMNENLAIYAHHASAAASASADIVVFPEDGLYGADFNSFADVRPFCEPIPAVPIDLARSAPPVPVDICTAPERFDNVQTRILFTAACLAQKLNLTVVLDMCDLQPCGPSISTVENNSVHDSHVCFEGHYQFNTQVALDPNGRLLGKYHKMNLFEGEAAYFNSALTAPELRFFDAPLGGNQFVRFGQFICFDIFFADPAELLVRHGIQNFVFSTYWDSSGTFPTILAHEMQQGWSRAHSANLLASNIGEGRLTSGSGIYSAGEALAYVYNNSTHPAERLLIVDVPIVPPQLKSSSRVRANSGTLEVPSARHQKIASARDSGYPAANNTYMRIHVNASSSSTRSSNFTLASADGAFSCFVSYEAISGAGDYILVNTHGFLLAPLLPASACAFISCPADSTNNCAQPFSVAGTVRFGTVQLSGEFEWGQVVIPLAELDGGILLGKEQLQFDRGVLSVSASASQISANLAGVVLFAYTNDAAH